jgi:hypothetical protein
MDNIISILPSKNVEQYLMWKYEEREDLYEKYTQYIDKTDIENKKEKTFFKPRELSNAETPSLILKQDPENRFTPPSEQKAVSCETVKRKNKHENCSKPITIVSKITDNAEINHDYMRSKMIEFISKKEFQKFFGVKKTADVMKGLTENRWNKSLALFISFMFDVSFIYLKKNVKYNVEKEYNHVFTI